MPTEKEKRNEQIYLEKEGITKLSQKKPVKKSLTYRKLIKKYGISQKRLQDIVNRYRARYNPDKLKIKSNI
jgi:Mor family transcriptional regulator